MVANVPCLGAGPLCGKPCALGQRPGSLGSVNNGLIFTLQEFIVSQYFIIGMATYSLGRTVNFSVSLT
jgi:hypothetical protein